jgi:hypothetical protein
MAEDVSFEKANFYILLKKILNIYKLKEILRVFYLLNIFLIINCLIKLKAKI